MTERGTAIVEKVAGTLRRTDTLDASYCGLLWETLGRAALLAALDEIRDPPEEALHEAMNAIGGGDYRQSVLTKWQAMIDALKREVAG